MAVCLFLGHWDIFDADIDSRLQEAVDLVIQKNKQVEFFVYTSGYGQFYNRCLLAALRAKARQPQDITITLVLHEEEYEKYLLQQRGSVPMCMIDKIVTPHFGGSNDSNTARRYMKVLRWLLDRSYYLISYLYEDLCSPANRLLDYAQKKAGHTVLDIASSATRQAILESVPRLSGREQFVFQKYVENHHIQGIDETLSISKARVQQLLNRGCREVRGILRRRYGAERALQCRDQACVCTIFAVGGATYEMLKVFESIACFLIENYDVRKFYVAEEYCHTGFMNILERLSTPQHRLHITAVVSQGGDWDTQSGRFSPPFDTVEQIEPSSSDSSIDKFLLKKGDFCICRLPPASLTKEAQKCSSLSKRAVFLDIGKSCKKSG